MISIKLTFTYGRYPKIRSLHVRTFEQCVCQDSRACAALAVRVWQISVGRKAREGERQRIRARLERRRATARGEESARLEYVFH